MSTCLHCMCLWLRMRGRSRSAWHYPFPKPQGPRPKIALDPVPQKSSWSARQKEEGPEFRYRQPLMCLLPPRLALGAEESVFLVPHGPTLVPGCPTAVIADKIKRIHFQKESKRLFLPTISVLPLCSQSVQPFQPFAWQAIPGVSEWVMTTVR